MHRSAAHCLFPMKTTGANCPGLPGGKIRMSKSEAQKRYSACNYSNKQLFHRTTDAKHILSVHHNPMLCGDSRDSIYSRLKV